MLRQRIITVVVLLLILLGPLFIFPQQTSSLILVVLFALFGGVACFEWARLVRIPVRLAWGVGGVCFFLSLVVVFTSVGIYLQHSVWFALSVGVSLWWLTVALMLSNVWINRLTLLCGLIWLVTGLIFIQKMAEFNYITLFTALLFVWIADSSAYFIGKLLGRHKLAPQISPGKTWEGFVGGLVCVLLFHFLTAQYMPNSISFFLEARWRAISYLWVVFIFLFSVGGDLLESKLKRSVGVKDSGSILPGHGGAFDRIDALLPAMAFLSLII
jgi:phosphatidate cytidylyltransferase